jgi:phage I-like protein
MPKLPKTITPGEPLEIQIAPLGEYPATLMGGDDPEPQRVVQRLDLGALRRVADAFAPEHELLVDVDHVSEAGGSTEAYGWITGLRVDEQDGLLATINWTSIGAEAVSDRRYRFVSPVFGIDLDSTSSTAIPSALLSLALTNTPNLPVRCVLNRATAANQNVEQNKKEEKTMIAEKLGLAPEATEEDILAAIEALQTRLADAEAATLNAEAEAVADEKKEVIANREEFIRLYTSNKATAVAMLNVLSLHAPTPKRTVNAADGRAPEQPKSKEALDADVVAAFRAMPPGREKDQYLVANRATLMRAMH